MTKQVRTAVEPVRDLHETDNGGYCMTYRVTYQIEDETGELPQVSKTQAKELTINMCKLIDTSFEEGVKAAHIHAEFGDNDPNQSKEWAP